MKNKKMVIVFILIAILLVAGIVVNVIAIKEKNENAEDLSTNIANNVDNTIDDDLELTGEKYNSADVTDENNKEVTVQTTENTPMVLIFWNHEEEKSIEAVKIVQSYYDKYSTKIDIKAVAEVDKNSKAKIISIASENNITMPIVYDTVDYSLSKANNVSKIPTILMINKNGEIINTLTDDINEDIIEANLDILAENY
jgi:hypothetical protein